MTLTGSTAATSARVELANGQHSILSTHASWAFTATEAWARGRAEGELVGHRAASPWDDGGPRPSHAEKRRAWRRELLAGEIHAALRAGLTEQEIRAAAERLLDLAA